MSKKRWPVLNAQTGAETLPDKHIHEPSDIEGDWDDITITGSLRSVNWDGGGDLSGGRDTTATEGFLLDAVSGRAQFEDVYAEGGSLTDLTVLGTLSLSGSGKIVTAASGQRVEITSANYDRISFHSGAALESLPGSLVTSTGTHPYLSMRGPSEEGTGTGELRVGSDGASRLSGSVITLYEDIYGSVITWTEGVLTIEGNTVPAANNAHDLGSSTYSFRNLYAYDIYNEAGEQVVDLSGHAIINPSNGRIQAADSLVQMDTYEGAAYQARIAAAKGGNISMYDIDGNLRCRIIDDGAITLRFPDETVVFQVGASGDNPISLRVGAALENVTQGASDSGGAGYRCLRVPN